MLVFFALGNAKVLSFALGDAIVPNANGFASQWNIGLNVQNTGIGKLSIIQTPSCSCCNNVIRINYWICENTSTIARNLCNYIKNQYL